MHLKAHKQSSGFSLIELMVALAIVSIISAVMFTAFQTQVHGQASQDVSLAMTQSLRAAMDIMAADIRMTGCDPKRIGLASGAGSGIQTAEDDNLVMTMDTGGGTDGEPNGKIDAGETIRYAINTKGNLGRQVDDGVLQPLHPIDLECSALNFVYLDADKNVISTPVTGPALLTIKSIQVSVVIQSADRGKANQGFLRSFTDNHSYKNLQGDVIFKAPGDTYRRFQLSKTIDCRNL